MFTPIVLVLYFCKYLDEIQLVFFFFFKILIVVFILTMCNDEDGKGNCHCEVVMQKAKILMMV